MAPANRKCLEDYQEAALLGPLSPSHSSPMTLGSRARLSSRKLLSSVALILLCSWPSTVCGHERDPHDDAMMAVDAGLGGDEQNGLMAGLAATSEKLRALEAGVEKGQELKKSLAALGSKLAEGGAKPSTEQVLATLKREQEADIHSRARQELSGDPDLFNSDISAAGNPLASRGRGSLVSNDVQWGYTTGLVPRDWGSEYPTCGKGRLQSPIDIQTLIASTKPEDIFNIAVLEWQYTKAAAEGAKPLVSGQNLFINLPVNSRFQALQGPGNKKDGSRRLLEMELYNGRVFELEGFGEATLRVDSAVFSLREMIAHTPSEHKIDGRAFDLEMQFVHMRKEGQGPNYLIISVLFSTGVQGDPPAFISKLASVIPLADGYPRGISNLDLGEIAEALRENLKTYYRYDGSLSSPPCTEGVEWFVTKEPLPVSKSDVKGFTDLQGQNARPIQALNGRTVRFVP